MAIAWFWNVWPFRVDELRDSKQLVKKLAISEETKQFVLAVRDPQTHSLIYILSALNLSERSASDATSLINHLKPDAVLVQAAVSPFSLLHSEDDALPFPTSSFGVIKRCFLHKIGRDFYDHVASNLVLREIFGTTFHGPLLAAKRAAQDVGSSFLVIESPSFLCKSINTDTDCDSGTHIVRNLVNSLVPQQHASSWSASAFMGFSLDKDLRVMLAKALSSHLDPLLLSNANAGSVFKGASASASVDILPSTSYETPGFARSIYPLLEDLYSIFGDLPSLGKALAHAQKMLLDVNRGDVLDKTTVAEVYTFRIAVEGLRIALNNKGLRPVKRKGDANLDKIEFSQLPIDEKSHALFAHAIRSQTDKFKTIVAVVDASALAGLRKHWDTPLPLEVKELVGELITNSEGKAVMLSHSDKKRSLTDKPMVAVGAGATAVFGASSLTKVIPASTLVKVVTFKIPTSLKIGLSQMQKIIAFAFGQSKVVAPGIATSGGKASGVMKAAVSAEKIRAVAHSLIASAEKTSISVMRTAFYEIMRKRKVRPVGFLPWATFAGSIGTCTGFLLYGDGIECAVESLPAAPSIASLGRGIQHLREASQAVMQAEGSRIQTSIESVIKRIKKFLHRKEHKAATSIQVSNEEAKHIEISKLQKMVDDLNLEFDAAELATISECNKNAVLQNQLQLSIKEKSGLERELVAMDEVRNENALLKDNYELLSRCIKEDLGFKNDKPLAASIMYKCLHHWHAFESVRIFDYVRDDDNVLPYWLSNTSALLCLLQRNLHSNGFLAATSQRYAGSSSLTSRIGM
ncbi:hypothetical protein VNO78_00758 [Psophocarpus tetragonolobus]|uniref:Uncharacterized protein n=1 Tax=Psophocarpus tetragonolobus TaxID=3891 RepID=A0AAN9SXQ3_PSOTE